MKNKKKFMKIFLFVFLLSVLIDILLGLSKKTFFDIIVVNLISSFLTTIFIGFYVRKIHKSKKSG